MDRLFERKMGARRLLDHLEKMPEIAGYVPCVTDDARAKLQACMDDNVRDVGVAWQRCLRACVIEYASYLAALESGKAVYMSYMQHVERIHVPIPLEITRRDVTACFGEDAWYAFVRRRGDASDKYGRAMKMLEREELDPDALAHILRIINMPHKVFHAHYAHALSA